MPPANTDRALFLLRLLIGIAFIIHGYQKLFVNGPDGVAGFFGSINVPLPFVTAWLVSLLEFFGGIALVLGVFTRITATLLAVTMVCAIWFAKRGEGFSGWELEYVLGGVAVALAIAGAGALSIDAGLARRTAGER